MSNLEQMLKDAEEAMHCAVLKIQDGSSHHAEGVLSDALSRMTTPPTPADTLAKPCIGDTMESWLQIPKPDFQGRLIGGKRSKSWVVEPDGTTSIERFATEQVARAERAEKSKDTCIKLARRAQEERDTLRTQLEEAVVALENIVMGGENTIPDHAKFRTFARNLARNTLSRLTPDADAGGEEF